MRKFFVLLRVSLRSMLHTFSFGRGKKRAATGAAALLFLGGLALYMSGIYSFLMAEALKSFDLLEFLLPLMAILSCMMALFLTAFGASGVVFGNKDSDLLLSMPVTSFSIMLSKILALYLENLLFCGMWMIPTCIAYFLQAPGSLLGFVVRALVCIPFLPFLPTLLGVLIGYCIAFFSARANHKALISNLLYFSFFGMLIVGSMQINRLSSLLLTNVDFLRGLFETWLLPFGLLYRSICLGDLFSLFVFCIFCALPFFAIVYLLSAKYKEILSTLSSHSLRTNFKLTHMNTRGRFYALLRKEIGRYFGTPIYFFNTGFGALILLGGSVYLCFARKTALEMLTMLQLGPSVSAIVCAVLAFCLGTVCTTCVSISLEGKTLWILKESPISTLQLFLSKLLTNFIVAWPVTVIALSLATWALSLPLAAVLCMLLLFTLFISHTALFGLIINLLLPKLDSDSDVLIVKQSAASVCGIFGGILSAGLGIGAYFLFGASLGFVPFLLLVSAFLSALCLLEWHWLTHRGIQIFARL